jgi:hypothetical protein
MAEPPLSDVLPGFERTLSRQRRRIRAEGLDFHRPSALCNDAADALRPHSAYFVEKLEKFATSNFPPNSVVSDFLRSVQPGIGCGGS